LIEFRGDKVLEVKIVGKKFAQKYIMH